MSKTTTKTTTTTRMTEAEARELTDAIKSNLDTLGKYILRVVEGKAHKAMGYSSIEEWAFTELGYGRSRIYQMAAWKRAENEAKELFDLSDNWELNEAAYRPIDWNELVAEATEEVASLTDQDQREVRITRLINAKYDETKERKRPRKSKSMPKAEAPDTPSIATTALDADDVAEIEQAPPAPAYIRTARDTGSMLVRLTDDEERDEVLAAVEHARNDLEVLITELKAEVK